MEAVVNGRHLSSLGCTNVRQLVFFSGKGGSKHTRSVNRKLRQLNYGSDQVLVTSQNGEARVSGTGLVGWHVCPVR